MKIKNLLPSSPEGRSFLFIVGIGIFLLVAMFVLLATSRINLFPGSGSGTNTQVKTYTSPSGVEAEYDPNYVSEDEVQKIIDEAKSNEATNETQGQ